MESDREKAQDAAERTFALLTAKYHDLPEFETLLRELTLDQALRVIRLMASLLSGTFRFTERLGRKRRGSILPTVVERVRRDTPWLR